MGGEDYCHSLLQLFSPLHNLSAIVQGLNGCYGCCRVKVHKCIIWRNAQIFAWIQLVQISRKYCSIISLRKRSCRHPTISISAMSHNPKAKDQKCTSRSYAFLNSNTTHVHMDHMQINSSQNTGYLNRWAIDNRNRSTKHWNSMSPKFHRQIKWFQGLQG